MIALRKRHPCLWQNHFLKGIKPDDAAMADISWHGIVLGDPQWENSKSRVLAFTLSRVESEEEERIIGQILPVDWAERYANNSYSKDTKDINPIQRALGFTVTAFKNGDLNDVMEQTTTRLMRAGEYEKAIELSKKSQIMMQKLRNHQSSYYPNTKDVQLVDVIP